MKNLFFVLLSLLGLATAQNRLYVYVDYDPSIQLLGYGGSGFYYDHILLLPDGTAFRFDDVSDGSDQVLPSGINLATATASELANAGGTQGTYQDQGGTIQTSFGVSFPSAGGKFDYDDALNGYMLIPPLQPSFITGEYRNFAATVIGGGLTNTPQVSAGESNNYYFYGDGKFGFEESKGVASTAGNVATTYSSEGSAAGSFVFEGYNLFLTYSDGTQAVLPAYLWPSTSRFEDQILMVGGDEFLGEEESSLPIQLLPANGSSAQQPMQNPSQDAAQNPLAQPSQNANPLAQPEEVQTTEQNPLGTPQPETPEAASGNTLSGTVTPPGGISLSGAFVSMCPYDMVDESDCVTAMLDESGSYSLDIPGAGEYIVMAALDADGNGTLNTGDYVGYNTFDTNGDEAATMDLSLEPYTE